MLSWAPAVALLLLWELGKLIARRRSPGIEVGRDDFQR